MAENAPPAQEATTETPAPAARPGAASRARDFLLTRGRAIGHTLPRLGLFLFILLTPLLVTGYPAYYIADKLLDYAAATSIEATLKDIEVTTVTAEGREGSLFSDRRHIEVSYTFRTEDRRELVAVQHESWPAPGLARKLDNLYEPGDPFVLYRMPNGQLRLDQEVAKATFLWLTGLMALAFLGSTLFFLEWKRLHRLKPAIMPTAPLATAKSLGIAQLVALSIACVQAVVIAHAPITVPMGLYLGIYLGVVAFLTVLLRLLVFESAPVAAAAPQEDERDRPRSR